MLRKSLPIMLLVLSGNIATAAAQAMPDPQRGELLYSTHCIACHTTQIHWRDKKLARDYPSLVAEVGRWQKLAGLGWNADDVASVARHLNALFYHYPVP